MTVLSEETCSRKIGFKTSPISGRLFGLCFSTGYVFLAFWFKNNSMKARFIVVLIKIETKIEYNKIKSTRNYFELCLTV